jgi:hypothetical protein
MRRRAGGAPKRTDPTDRITIAIPDGDCALSQTHRRSRPPRAAQGPEARLAGVMGVARALARDICALADESPACRDHPLIRKFRALCDARRILDPEFAPTLAAIVASLDRGAETAEPDPDDGADATSSASVPSRRSRLVSLAVRASALQDAVEQVVDAVMAEEAIREARFFPLAP